MMIHEEISGFKQAINGFKLIVVNPTTIRIKRSWRERLFTLPWSPFDKFRDEIHEMISDGDVIADRESKIIYCNAKTAGKIRKSIEEGLNNV